MLLWRGDEEALYQTAGFADIQNNRPVARDTIFRLDSPSKPITAVAAMTLIQQGKLDGWP